MNCYEEMIKQNNGIIYANNIDNKILKDAIILTSEVTIKI